MVVKADGSDRVLLAPLRREINKRLSKGRAEKLNRFAEYYYTTAAADEISQLSTEDLYLSTLSSWQYIQSRTGRGCHIVSENDEILLQDRIFPRTTIRILVDDMPFLVDSICQEFNLRGLALHSIHNLVFQAARVRGKLHRFNPPDGAKTSTEALICVHVERLSDSEQDDLRQALREVLRHVCLAVGDFSAMRANLISLRERLLSEPQPVPARDLQETVEFLRWMESNHFTFLGYEKYSILPSSKGLTVNLQKSAVLGISGLKKTLKSKVFLADLPKSVAKQILKKQLCSFSKSSQRSRVHRPAYYDYVLIKEFDSSAKVCTEHRFVGLYTSTVYGQPPLQIPLLRVKVQNALDRSGFSANGHNIKALLQVITVLPREELFQLSEKQLFETALQIEQIQERKQIRLFLRKDTYSKFFSCLVYIPREIFSTEVRIKIQQALCEKLSATEVEFNTFFSESILARTHFILRVADIENREIDIKKIEAEIIELVKPWQERFCDALINEFGVEKGRLLGKEFDSAFSNSYKEDFDPKVAVEDVKLIAELEGVTGLAMSLYRKSSDLSDIVHFKLFNQDQALVLSDVIPILENMGFKVISERPYQLNPRQDQAVWLHDFSLSFRSGESFDIDCVKDIFQQAFSSVWSGTAQDDAFNALVIGAQLGWREVALFRAYSAYMKQIRVGFSQDFIASTLVKYPQIPRLLSNFFWQTFSPSVDVSTARRNSSIAALEKKIVSGIDGVDNLTEDNALKLFLRLFKATLRTNYYQTDENNQFKDYFSFKLLPELISEIPSPRPKYEIFVYSTYMEGVHLRGGKVARGGLRWSDRLEDYRTEVLGLVKAQQVKNSVIVPVGAKGGFVVKKPLGKASREELLQQGISCYKTFIRGLLDITDNFSKGKIVPPVDVIRLDDDDIYLVVAADKGTATFSDIANAIAAEFNFWLGDGFASGGSNGYDHKKMGITAKGAWISVQRHFREMGVNIQETDFTVVGIGDMSGDVFGNGMLLSKHICLVAAFNHMHIFLDPNPLANVSFKERRRLFKLPRSSWSDYDQKLISRGGGIFSRSAKSIPVSAEMKTRFQLRVDAITPDKLISELLKAPVDLLWNGGIGTYVKAVAESHADAGDKANDKLRVDARDLMCRVIGEGGNLGFTQAARVEYGLHGGVSFTDFIDNAAGVDCSDHEVNIKILLQDVSSKGRLTVKQVGELLVDMTDEVGALVLKNNYRQVQALGLAMPQVIRRAKEYRGLINYLEEVAGLDRKLEYLPDDEELTERNAKDEGLTRPELSVLTSYAKMHLKEKIKDADFVDDAYMLSELHTAFPATLHNKFPRYLSRHRLKKEIIATQLANSIVNLMGSSFVFRMVESTGADPVDVAKAFVVARDVYRVEDLWQQIESLDFKLDTAIQAQMMVRLSRLIRRACRWLLRNKRVELRIAAEVGRLSKSIAAMGALMPDILHGKPLQQWQQQYDHYRAHKVPEELAQAVAGAGSMYSALGITEVVAVCKVPIKNVVDVYFSLGDRLELAWLSEQINELDVSSYWQALARETFHDDLDWQQRSLTVSVIKSLSKAAATHKAIDDWMLKHQPMANRWQKMLAELHSAGRGEYSMYSVALRELLDFSQTTAHRD